MFTEHDYLSTAFAKFPQQEIADREEIIGKMVNRSREKTENRKKTVAQSMEAMSITILRIACTVILRIGKAPAMARAPCGDNAR